MVIELAWRLFLVNYLTDGEDEQRKVGRQEIGDLRSVVEIAGKGLRGAGYELRGAGCGQLRLRAKGTWRIKQDVAQWKVQEDQKGYGLQVTRCRTMVLIRFICLLVCLSCIRN